MIANKSISVVFPMYNEKEYLPLSIEEADIVLREITFDYEIIVVDDASCDGSGKIADDIAKENNKVKVFHHKKNRKLGGALKTGFYNATKDVVVYTDIDLPFNLKILKDVIPLISGFDIIIGCRTGKREFFLRVIYSWVYNRLINFIFRLRIKDINFALKIFRREILNEIELKSEGSFINAELLSKAKKLGLSIKEIEVEYRQRMYGISRLYTPRVILKVIYEMIRFYPEVRFFSKKRVIYTKLKKLYQKTNFSARIYNRIRFKTCPFALIKKFIPERATVLDLGCGTGLFLNFLSLSLKDHCLFVGVDKDERKIQIAKESLSNQRNIEFRIDDICRNSFGLSEPPKCITLIDVLYFLDVNSRRELLNRCFKILDGKGVLIIKEIEKILSLKYLWVFIQEFLAVKVFHLTLAKGFYFETRRYYLSLLEEIGFSVKTFDLSKGYFYPHILYVCKK